MKGMKRDIPKGEVAIDIFDIIAQARQLLDSDPHLANYMLRDTEEVKRAGLAELSWAMHREYPHRNDVLYLIQRLEAWLHTNSALKRGGITAS